MNNEILSGPLKFTVRRRDEIPVTAARAEMTWDDADGEDATSPMATAGTGWPSTRPPPLDDGAPLPTTMSNSAGPPLFPLLIESLWVAGDATPPATGLGDVPGWAAEPEEEEWMI